MRCICGGLTDSELSRVVHAATETARPVAHVDDLCEAAAELLDDHGLRVGLGDAAPLALLGLRQHALAARLHHVGGDEAERLPGEGKRMGGEGISTESELSAIGWFSETINLTSLGNGLPALDVSNEMR